MYKQWVDVPLYILKMYKLFTTNKNTAYSTTIFIAIHGFYKKI